MVVCTGIMLRITDEHPYHCDYWWTSPDYSRHLVEELKVVDPNQGGPAAINYNELYEISKEDWKKDEEA